MLRNPAYKGKACFGKTRSTNKSPKRTKKQRERGGPSPRARCHEDVPADQWIEIGVPAIVGDATFEWAGQRLEENRRMSRRRTIEPSILQGLLVCKECGYALYRTSTTTSAGKKIYYYRCIGSDNYRFEEGRVCASKPVRVDMLDDLVWAHLVELLRTPELVEAEIERRKQASRETRLAARQQKDLGEEIRRLEKQINRLLDAYQEGILTLDELRGRAKPINVRLAAARTELANARAATVEEGRHDVTGKAVIDFLNCLRTSEGRLTPEERQQIVRLLIKEVVVSGEVIKVHHSIPIPKKKLTRPPESYSLCTRRHDAPLRATGGGVGDDTLLHYSHLQELLDVYPSDRSGVVAASADLLSYGEQPASAVFGEVPYRGVVHAACPCVGLHLFPGYPKCPL